MEADRRGVASSFVIYLEDPYLPFLPVRIKIVLIEI